MLSFKFIPQPKVFTYRFTQSNLSFQEEYTCVYLGILRTFVQKVDRPPDADKSKLRFDRQFYFVLSIFRVFVIVFILYGVNPIQQDLPHVKGKDTF